MMGGRLRARVGAMKLGTRRFNPYDGYFAESEVKQLGLPEDRIWGAVGTNFFEGCSLGLNFRDKEIWLAPARDPGEGVPHPEGTRDPVIVPLERPKGYLLLDVAFGEPTDDGTTACSGPCNSSVVLEEVWKTVPHRNSRIFPTFSMDVNDTLLHGYYQRADALWTTGFKKRDTPVHVIEKWDYLQESMTRNLELVEKLVGIVGLETVLDHHTVIDFENNRILLFAYDDCGHLPRNRYNGFGFVLGPGSPFVVQALVPESFAEMADIKIGDILCSVAKMVDDESTVEISLEGIVQAESGTRCHFVFERDGKEIELDLIAEDLLPPLNETR